MKIYDKAFESVKDIIDSNEHQILDIGKKSWPEAEKNEIIFKGDSLYELGSSGNSGFSTEVVTSDSSYVDKNEVILIGKDLMDIKNDTPYARIALLKINEEKMGSGNDLYKSIRKIDYTRYHVNPQGFMLLISSMNQTESVRVSKKAVKNKISFADVGGQFINEYLKHPAVEAVKLIFITAADFDYGKIKEIASRVEGTTQALDHLLNKVKMDCHSCSLQVICNEVEKLCEEDFKKNESE